MHFSTKVGLLQGTAICCENSTLLKASRSLRTCAVTCAIITAQVEKNQEAGFLTVKSIRTNQKLLTLKFSKTPNVNSTAPLAENC